MDYYDIIFNELQNRVNREELTLEMAEEINDLAYNKYICEKKTRQEYRKEKFKKDYDFKPDKPGSRSGSITIDGNQLPFEFSKDKNKAQVNNTTKKISIGDNTFNSRHPKTKDFTLGHEYGHLKAKEIKSNNPEKYKQFESMVQKKISGKIDKQNEHGNNPEEYYADHVSKKMLDKKGINGKKVSKQALDDLYRKDINKKKFDTSLEKNVGKMLKDNKVLYKLDMAGLKSKQDLLNMDKSLIKTLKESLNESSENSTEIKNYIHKLEKKVSEMEGTIKNNVEKAKPIIKTALKQSKNLQNQELMARKKIISE